MISKRKASTIVDEAVAKSILAEFPTNLRNALTEDAISVELPAGTTLYEDQDEPRCGLVITGLVRVYMGAPDGRQITVRYAHPGELLGIATIVSGPAPVSVQILTDATLLMLNVRTLQRSGQTEPLVGWLFAKEVTHRLYDTLEALAGNTFGPLQARVARHLLDLATPRQQGRGLLVSLTQQELADAVGSVRPAVARILRDLREAGIIRTFPNGIVILQPAELHAKTWSRDGSPMLQRDEQE